MAGGEGKRFWPKSRSRYPKQFLRLASKDSLLQQTVARLKGVVAQQQILVVTAAAYDEEARRQLPDLPSENIIVEPVGRNTAPAIALAAIKIKQRSPNGVMLITPADQLIKNVAAYRKTIKVALTQAEAGDYLISLGIWPRYPETGYGYIVLGDKFVQQSGIDVYQIQGFLEKPKARKAKRLCSSGQVLWNSGIFAWRVSTILSAIERYLPRLYQEMSPLETAPPAREMSLLEDIYQRIESISIDYGIMEKYPDVLAVEGRFYWSDVGSWAALEDILPQDRQGNVVIGRHVGLKSRRLIVHSPDKLVATLGLEDIIIVDTDDVLLVCPKSRSQELKKMLELLRQKGFEKYL